MTRYWFQKSAEIFVLLIQTIAYCFFLGGAFLTLLQLQRHEDKLEKLATRVEIIAHRHDKTPEEHGASPGRIVPKATYY